MIHKSGPGGKEIFICASEDGTYHYPNPIKPQSFLSRLKTGIKFFFTPPEDLEEREAERVAGLLNLSARMSGMFDTVPGSFSIIGFPIESLIQPQENTPQKS